MKNIFFKARDIHGEPHYGGFWRDNENHYVIDNKGELILINPETICQFTGMYTTDGKMVFEGDEVRLSSQAEGLTGANFSFIGVVTFVDFQLVVLNGANFISLGWVKNNDMTIVIKENQYGLF